MPIGPPDASFDHANFYYRYEYAGPFETTASSTTTIACADMGATLGAYAGFSARIISGTGRGQERSISANDQTTLTIAPPWSTVPDLTSLFAIVEPTWIFAAVSNTSPARFEIPFAQREVIQISGRSANVNNQEASVDLCPITRCALGGGNPDFGVPGVPDFVLTAIGSGNLTLSQIGFADSSNISSVTSGTLELYQWNELNTPSPYSLAAPVDAISPIISLNEAAEAYVGQAIQIDSEVVTILGVNVAENVYTVLRGALGSVPAAHLMGDLVLHLDNVAVIVPFAPDFFQNRSSANYIHTVALPDVRIVIAQFLVNNSFGPSQSLQQSFAALNPDVTLRTLSGGQFSIQVNGYLATQQNAAPPLIVEASHAIRDMRATVNQAAIGYDIVVQVLQDGVAYGDSLTISSGTLTSASIVEGANLPPLVGGSVLTINIALNNVSGSVAVLSPGRDLTVTIRL
jgi:hypothetical protein